MKRLIKAYNEALLDTDRERALQVVQQALNQGKVSAEDMLFKMVIPSISQSLETVGVTYGASLAQYLMASQIGAEITDVLVARFENLPESAGCVVIGTAAGDFHGLGKRIVCGCLKVMMIQAVDLGLSVSAEQFVAEAIKNNAQVIGISAMMVHTARSVNGCLRVRKLLQEKGLEDKIKIIVGGAPFRYDPELYKTVQADAWAENGLEAGSVITNLIREVRQQ
ncbi:MAG TPA: cobalamin-dependent protein [Patescibacteria group bacterium]|nr:cobalamin-dependent protein [Patescibacteria group bacterium]